MKKSISTTAVAAVAAGAAASAGANAALAADPTIGVEPEWFLSLEGGVLFADPAIDKAGGLGSGSGISIDFDDFDTDFGYRGAAKFGKKFNDNLDWRLGVAYSDFVKNHASLSVTGITTGSGSGSGSGSIEGDGAADFSYLTGDLELGYNVRPSDRFDLRVFGGLRALNSRDTQDKFGEIDFGGSGGSIAIDARSEFLGIGPRVGVDFSGKLSDDSMLGFSGMLATAVIFGDLKTKFEASTSGGIGSGSGISDTFHDNETIFNLEAAFGTDFHVTDNAVLTLGYRGEYWDDIRFSDKIGGSGETHNTLSHGPFLRFTTEF